LQYLDFGSRHEAEDGQGVRTRRSLPSQAHDAAADTWKERIERSYVLWELRQCPSPREQPSKPRNTPGLCRKLVLAAGTTDCRAECSQRTPVGTQGITAVELETAQRTGQILSTHLPT
jgi:hypothetical protein